VIRAVFDTNVFLRALINPHSRCGRLLGEFAADYELVFSPAIVREVLEVLHRPRLRAKFPQITQLDVTRIIALFEQAVVVEPQDMPALWRDPADDKFLICTRAAGAKFLVTEHKGLLASKTYELGRICRPVEFIVLLEAGRAKAKSAPDA
jgi:putative PIN family toxin of toxin-antitoxin system